MCQLLRLAPPQSPQLRRHHPLPLCLQRQLLNPKLFPLPVPLPRWLPKRRRRSSCSGIGEPEQPFFSVMLLDGQPINFRWR